MLRTEITKSHLNNHICQHRGMKTSTVTPSFYYVFNISLYCYDTLPNFIGNLWRVLLPGNHLNMVYKSLNGLAPDYLKSMFTDRSATSTYSLRNCEGKLALPLPRTNFLKNSFSYSGAVLWNSLPTNLQQAQTLASFKSGCRGFLFDND